MNFNKMNHAFFVLYLLAPKTSRKSSKDMEKERPPWRTVIIAPPSKVNKNALLKAKILDATRRALLAQKINHVGTQTDAYATVLREKSIGVQKDLILMLDKSADTGGTITIRKDRPGGLIIAQTIGQMTENTPSNTIATQTPLPRTYLSFASLATKTNSESANKFSPFENQILGNELLLQTQRNALKTVDAKLNESYQNNRKDHQENAVYEKTTSNDFPQDEKSKSVSPPIVDSVAQHYKTDKIAMKMRENAVQNATFACWDDFDFPSTEDDLPDLPRTTISAGSMPWNHFEDIVIGRRMASMTLLPLQKRPKSNTKKKSVTWNDRQLAVTMLINEASALIIVFNEVSMMLGPEMSLNPIPSNDASTINIPKSKWDPILSKSCNDLEQSLEIYKPKQHLSSAQLIALPK